MSEERTLGSRRASIAALLSLLGTGAGHLYAGRARRGLILFALALLFVPVCFVVASQPPSALGLWVVLGCAALSVVVFLAAIVDAVWCALRAPRPYVQRPCNHVALYALLAVVATGWGVGGAYLVRANAFEAFKIATASMAPTLGANDRILVNKIDPAGTARRGDIVVFAAPDDSRRVWVKRLVGLPGDTIEFRDEKVLRNGEPLREARAPGTPDETLVVPAGMCYLLGDGRRNSHDSRHFGPVSIGALRGIAQYVLPWSTTPSRSLK